MQRAVLFWSGGLCRTGFRAWQLATRLGRQAQQAGQQVSELYVGVEAVRFEAPQLEWLHEERITRLFLELHPLVTARPLQSEAFGVPPVSAAADGRPAELPAPVEETVELLPGSPPAELLRAALASSEAGACVVYISLHGATSRKVAPPPASPQDPSEQAAPSSQACPSPTPTTTTPWAGRAHPPGRGPARPPSAVSERARPAARAAPLVRR